RLQSFAWYDQDGNRARPMVSDAIDTLNALGYTPDENDIYRIKCVTKENDREIMPASYREPGRLYILKGRENLNLLDISKGESDGLDLQYNDFGSFAKAREAGYDGVIIDDFLQSRNWGNVGHRAIAIFETGLQKMEHTNITAYNHDPSGG